MEQKNVQRNSENFLITIKKCKIEEINMNLQNGRLEIYVNATLLFLRINPTIVLETRYKSDKANLFEYILGCNMLLGST